jgi:anti-anti-sigma factor
MRVVRTTQDDVTVISLIGDLDGSTVEQTMAALAGMPPAGTLLLDLGGVCSVSGAGLRALLVLYRRARRDRLRLALAAVPADLGAVLAGTGFAESLVLTDTVTAGVRVLSR